MDGPNNTSNEEVNDTGASSGAATSTEPLWWPGSTSEHDAVVTGDDTSQFEWVVTATRSDEMVLVSFRDGL